MRTTTPITDNTTIDPDDMFRRHEALLHHVARHYHVRNPHIEMEEFVGEGNVVFCKCLQKWDPAAAAFSTLFTRSLHNSMLNLLARKWAARVPTVELDEYHGTVPTQRDGQGWMNELMGVLGKDAQHVVYLTMRGDLPVPGHESRATVRTALRRHLRAPTRRLPRAALNVRWPMKRIVNAFTEIENALNIC